MFSTPNIVFFFILFGMIIFHVFTFLILRRLCLRGTVMPNQFDELYLKLKEEIKSTVAPKFLNLSIEINEIADLAIEIWRVEQRIAKASLSIPDNQLKGLENSVQKMKRYIEKYDIEIIDYKDHKYNEGLNLDILSIEKDPSLAEPVVKETIEPTIMLKGQVIRKAKIILLCND